MSPNPVKSARTLLIPSRRSETRGKKYWDEGGSTYGKISSEPQPRQIRHHGPRRHFVDLAPDVRQVAGDAGQEDDVGGGFDGAFELEEEGHPD